jgi:GTPase Era involved in 16S rRNA processing
VRPGQSLLDAIRAELRALLSKLETYLGQDNNADLQLRVEKLDQASKAGALLQHLDRVITTHGLVEYRTPMATIIDRLESRMFEIAVFGRVSTGKSSLLNYLLEVNYLPVGVTPVTAVPTRITCGLPPQVGIEFADHPPKIVGFSELQEFATEQGNPNNSKHVMRIQVQLCSPRLKDGITFVDTPGLGSLALRGSAETLAYLPRCDLGILLVEASAGLATEDLAVIDALYSTGSGAMVLISKADLFTDAERARLVEYVARQVQHEIQILPPIFPISVVGNSSILCDRWYIEHLQPILETHHQLAARTTDRKIAVLRATVVATLERRLVTFGKSSLNNHPQAEMFLDGFRDVQTVLERALAKSFETEQAISGQTEEILNATRDELARQWRQGSPASANDILVAKLTELLAEPTSRMKDHYDQSRAEALEALNSAERIAAARDPTELPQARGMPPLDPAGLAKKLDIKRPPLVPILPMPVLKCHLDGQLRAQISSELNDFLNFYAKQLRHWLRESVGDLKQKFESAADMYRVELRGWEKPMPEDAGQMAADLERLKSST